MVTHDAHAAAIADRILFLADGLIVKDLGPSSAHEILDALEEVTAAMIGVAIKGLLGRKLRATLTGFAIVLGVAMISGAFVLTDTLGKSFDGIYNESYKATDAVISSKAAIEIERPRATRRRRSRPTCLTRGRGAPRRTASRRARSRTTARLVEPNGDAIGKRGRGRRLRRRPASTATRA